MKKWRLLGAVMLVLGLMGSIAAAEGPDLPVVVVDLPMMDDTVDWMRARIGALEGYVLLDGINYHRQTETDLWSFG
jgi:hypothetical protein